MSVVAKKTAENFHLQVGWGCLNGDCLLSAFFGGKTNTLWETNIAGSRLENGA